MPASGPAGLTATLLHGLREVLSHDGKNVFYAILLGFIQLSGKKNSV